MGNLSHLNNIINFDNTPPPLDQQIREAMSAAGIDPPSTISYDGLIHRFATSDKPHDSSGWYVLFSDNVPSGAFGDWRTGTAHNFRARIDRPLTAADEMLLAQRMAEARKIREQDIAQKRIMAADTASRIWDSAGPASGDHAYLKRKGVQAHIARIGGDGRLILPLYNEAGDLTSVQYIDTDGGKLYHAGGQVSACFCTLGDPASSSTVYVAEGFATAATIAETMHAPTVAAFSASNIVPVVEILRRKYSTHQIIIAADNDKSGTGMTYATQASAKYGAQVILIPIEGMDANDYKQAGHDLQALLGQPENAGIKALDIISSDDLSSDYMAPDEIVQGLFVAGEISVLYGASNSGKTFLSVAMADAVASSQNFLNRRVDGGDVLYIAAESPASIKVRIQAINKHFERTVSGVHIAQAQVNLYSRPEFASLIVQAVSELEEKTSRKVKMIIMDTLARITAGANENTGEDMAPILEALDRIAKATHTALIVIHHSGKDQLKGSRGWSGIYGAVDAEIEVKEEQGRRFFRVSKQRQLGTKEQTFGFDLVVVEMGVDKWGDPSTTCVVIPAEVEKEDKLEHEKSILIDCCRHIGKLDEIDGKLFVSGAALSIQLFDLGYAKSETSAKQMVKPSAGGYLCNKLKEKRILIHRNGGYIIEDQDLSDFIRLGIKGI